MSNSEGLFLGIDTSNYTTSCALCTADGEIIANLKKPLPVADGERGLRQSDAVFHHTAALPSLASEVRELLGERRLAAVGSSERPRDADGSYMPCFLPGKSAGHFAAAASDVPYYGFSHQCGHIMAALYSSGKQELIGREFAAFHVSGGTTDLTIVNPDDAHVFNIVRIGGTLDINAGQAIDRAGVMMGLHFPCGAELERLALEYGKTQDRCGVSVKGLSCNLSGLENKAAKLFAETDDRGRVAAFVLDFVCRTLEGLTKELLLSHPGIPIIYAGGVMSCSIIKERLSRYGSFAEPCFSSDNAAGVALLTRLEYQKNK